MADTWTTPADTARREPTEAELLTIEDVLDTAQAWADGQLTLPQALTIALDTPRAIGTAFRFGWDDPRRPALERLHDAEYDRRYDSVRTNFGRVSRAEWEMVQRNNASRRAEAGWHESEAA